MTILGKAGTGKTTITGEYINRIQQIKRGPIKVICGAFLMKLKSYYIKN